jgi:predicted nucleic acid-binding protein
MTYKPVSAAYDACVLYPFHLRNLLVQCGVDRLVDVHWTDQIHDEWIRNLAANRSDISVERLTKTRDLMKQVLPSADVTGYERLVLELTLPDPSDRHVLAAAITAGASHIVTWNQSDFPSADLTPYHITASTPDDFLVELYRVAPDATIAMVANARRNLRTTVPSVPEFIEALEAQHLLGFGALLRPHSEEL